MNRTERKEHSRRQRRIDDKAASSELDEVPPPRKQLVKTTKVFRLEIRFRPDKGYTGGGFVDWTPYWKRYRTVKARDAGLATLNRSDRLFEYRLPPA